MTPWVKPCAAVTLIVSVALAPSVTESVPADGASVMPGAAVTFPDIVVEAVRVPEESFPAS